MGKEVQRARLNLELITPLRVSLRERHKQLWKHPWYFNTILQSSVPSLGRTDQLHCKCSWTSPRSLLSTSHTGSQSAAGAHLNSCCYSTPSASHSFAPFQLCHHCTRERTREELFFFLSTMLPFSLHIFSSHQLCITKHHPNWDLTYSQREKNRKEAVSGGGVLRSLSMLNAVFP